MTNARFPLMTGSEYEAARADRRAAVAAFRPVHLRAGTSFLATCDTKGRQQMTRVFDWVTCPDCIRITLDVIGAGGEADVFFADDLSA